MVGRQLRGFSSRGEQTRPGESVKVKASVRMGRATGFRPSRTRFAAFTTIALALALTVGWSATRDPQADEDPDWIHCMTTGWSAEGFSAGPAEVQLGAPVTVQWSMKIVSGCERVLAVTLDGHLVSAQGSLIDHPQASKTYQLMVSTPDGNQKAAGSAAVTVAIPATSLSPTTTSKPCSARPSRHRTPKCESRTTSISRSPVPRPGDRRSCRDTRWADVDQSGTADLYKELAGNFAADRFL